MSVHTFRQRTALQRAQQRWQPRANHLQVVRTAPAQPAKASWLDRTNQRLWGIHDGHWLWIVVAAIVGAADIGFIVELLGWWHP